MKKFRAVIQSEGSRGGGAWVNVPFDVEKVFGKKRAPVLATIDGVRYRGSLVRMGARCHMLLILKAIREKIGKKPGDSVSVTVREDTVRRTVSVPADVRAALGSKPRAKTFFSGLAYTHQREYVEWIKEAKRPETRQRRITQMLVLLQTGKKER